ncbi:DNA mismatch repair protein MutS, partial [Parabacteroides distasonis]
MAEIDALVSLATYAANNPANTFPQIFDDDSESVIEAVDVCHPFLAVETAVPNSFKLQKHNIAIVTGANMAGKST